MRIENINFTNWEAEPGGVRVLVVEYPQWHWVPKHIPILRNGAETQLKLAGKVYKGAEAEAQYNELKRQDEIAEQKRRKQCCEEFFAIFDQQFGNIGNHCMFLRFEGEHSLKQSDPLLETLVEYINSHANNLAFDELSLRIRLEDLHHPVFLQLLQALNNTNLKRLELDISPSLRDAFDNFLQNYIDLSIATKPVRADTEEIINADSPRVVLQAMKQLYDYLRARDVAAWAHYAITVFHQHELYKHLDSDKIDSKKIYSSIEADVNNVCNRKQFEQQIITTIQQFNLARLAKPATAVVSRHMAAFMPADDPTAPRIKAKYWLQPGVQRKKTKSKIVVQHLENVNTNQNVNLNITQNSIVQQKQAAEYLGDKLDYARFKSEYANYNERLDAESYLYNRKFATLITPEHYETLEKELFANLPKAIKYVTPAAAMALNKHVQAFGAFPDPYQGHIGAKQASLPQHFVIRGNAETGLVLDYDRFAINSSPDVYTPNECRQFLAERPIYSVDIPWECKKRWFVLNRAPDRSNLPITEKYEKHIHHIGPEYRFNYLDNLWIRYGAAGVNILFDALEQCDQHYKRIWNQKHLHKQPIVDTDNEIISSGIFNTLYDTYLHHFPSWDYFLDDRSFLTSLQRLQSYDFDKWRCLANFLDCGRKSKPTYRLGDLLDAFDDFWDQWCKLAKSHNVAIDSLYIKVPPMNGEAVVYLQRVLTILKNARDLREQVELFAFGNLKERAELLAQGDVQEQLDQYAKAIDLDSYGAYYASKYEGFKVVSPQMQLIYNPEVQNAQPFNPDRTIYRVELQEICDDLDTENTTEAQLKAKLYRFVGGLQHGVSYTSFDAAFNACSSLGGFNITVAKVLTIALFLTSHKRYAESPSFKDLTDKIFNRLNQPNILDRLRHGLLNLYKLNIFLSPAEFMLIIDALVRLTDDSVDNGVAKLFAALQKNQYAVFKSLKFLSDHFDDQDKLAYEKSIDMANLLAQDPLFNAQYADDLLLFATMCNPPMRDVTELNQYLLLAERTNLDQAFRILLNCNELLAADKLLLAFKAIAQLKQADHLQVKNILIANGFTISANQATVLTRGDDSIKNLLIELIMAVKIAEKHGIRTAIVAQQQQNLQLPEDAQLTQLQNELVNLDAVQLEAKLNAVLAGVSPTLYASIKLIHKPLYARINAQFIKDEFNLLPESAFVDQLKDCILDLKSFSDSSTFERIARNKQQAKDLADKFAIIAQRVNFTAHLEAMQRIFNHATLSRLEYETLNNLLTVLIEMRARVYVDILKALFSHTTIINDKQQCNQLIAILNELHQAELPSAYITRIISLVTEQNLGQYRVFCANLINAFNFANNDPLLHWLMTNANLNFDQSNKIASLTVTSRKYRDQIQKLLQLLQINEQLDEFLATIAEIPLERQQAILEMIARSESVVTIKTRSKDRINYSQLALQMNALEEEFEALQLFYTTTIPSTASINTELAAYELDKDFAKFEINLQTAPFGKRPLDEQFATSQVERVVNAFVDRSNNNSGYSYSQRKQMLEAFMFVNAAGRDLPVYNNKSAMQLSNEEIQAIFLDIKYTNKYAHLDAMQRRIYSLALMREAMYRTTGQFPFSTQMLALIDCIMHEGDLIQNIDTGQGKSLVDTMKAALLWLESDRVDISTSSVVDAKRDLEIYTPFLNLLGIPCASEVITAKTKVNAYAANGVNYTTMAQIALFSSKAKADRMPIGKPTDRVSLVMNESDYTLLDDKTIYRFATTDNPPVPKEHDWIYTAINDYVQTSVALPRDRSERQDAELLRAHLIRVATENNSATAVELLSAFPYKQLAKWLAGAIEINYLLSEKDDYDLTSEAQLKEIDNEWRPTRLALILMEGGKFSPDTEYGEGMQQLLHAKLNAKHGADVFAISREAKTIISKNNKNMIDFYRSKRGFIWGSSGTVGSDLEVQQQSAAYGFEFSQVASHQPKQVHELKPQILASRELQFAALIKQLLADQSKPDAPPVKVFFKDIKTAEAFYLELQQTSLKKMQIFTGMQDEVTAINKAAEPGMITVTTPAFGRNTDVPYERSRGMTVYQTFIDTTRLFDQRSGRTGRQGSPGRIYTVLNNADYENGITLETIAAVKQQNEEAAEQDRNYYADLYALLGYFFRSLDAIPAEELPANFYNVIWAQFSDDLEQKYIELLDNDAYVQQDFVNYALSKFNSFALMDLQAGQILQFLQTSYQPAVKQDVYTKAITIAECSPPDVIAYQFLNKTILNSNRNTVVAINTANKSIIAENLDKLFKAIANNNYYASNKDYIDYLNKSDLQLQAIRDAHQKYLANFLTEQVTASKKTFFVKRWLGFQGPLNKIAGNHNYLLMFKALTDLSMLPAEDDLDQDDLFTNIENIEPDNELILAALQQSIAALLKEYLQTCWFISGYKRTETRKLINDVERAVDVHGLITVISNSKLKIMQEDINKQTSRKLHHYKKINANGHSRFQESLDNALALTAAITAKDVSVPQLEKLQKVAITNSNQTTAIPVALNSLDSYKHAETKFMYKDKYNAAVTARSIESVLKRKKPTYNGMRARRVIQP